MERIPRWPNTQATENLLIGRLLADAGYDAEANHRFCRRGLGIRSTVIPVNDRRLKEGQTKGHYRNQMKNNFPKRKFRQRWQVECVVSRMKRRLGYALRARTDESRGTECGLRVLTYNLMLLYLLFTKNF
jgi:transposase